MKPEHIETVLNFPCFQQYDDRQKSDLIKLLETSDITLAQMDMLFNEESISGGIICDAVASSHSNNLTASWLGKIINNSIESPDGFQPPKPIISTVISGVGSYNENIAQDIKKIIQIYALLHDARLILQNVDDSIDTSQPRRFRNSLFSNNSEEIHQAEEFSALLKTLNQNGLDKPWVKSAIITNIYYAPGIYRVVKMLSELGILNISNIERCLQKVKDIAMLAGGIDMLERQYIFKYEPQKHYDKLLETCSLQGPEFINFIKSYIKENYKPAFQLDNNNNNNI